MLTRLLALMGNKNIHFFTLKGNRTRQRIPESFFRERILGQRYSNIVHPEILIQIN